MNHSIMLFFRIWGVWLSSCHSFIFVLLFCGVSLAPAYADSDLTPLQAVVQEKAAQIKLLPTQMVLGSIDLSEFPPATRIDWMRGQQFLMICAGKENVPSPTDPDQAAGSVAAMIFYRLDVEKHTLGIIGTQQQFHDPKEFQGWHILDVEHALFLFPFSAPAQFEPLAAVYRLNTPGGLAVQPYRSVNRGFLDKVLFAQLANSHQAHPTLEIRDGLGRIIIRSPVLDTLPAAAQFQDCGIASGDNSFLGLLGVTGSSGEFQKLAYYALPRHAPDASIGTHLHWLTNPLLIEPSIKTSIEDKGFVFPVVAAVQPGTFYYWRHQQIKTVASPETIDFYACMQHKGDNPEQVVDWIAFYLPNKQGQAMLLDSKTTTWQPVTSQTGKTPAPGQLPPLPLLACAPDGKTLVLSHAWDLFCVSIK